LTSVAQVPVAQLWQLPVQATLQQVPPAQKRLWHCVLRLHGWPLLSTAMQLEPLHQKPFAQSASMPHALGQVAP
jgi:hypothetical protein